MEIKADIRSECFDQCSVAAGCPPLRDALCLRMSRIHAEAFQAINLARKAVGDRLQLIAKAGLFGVDA